MNKRLAIVLTLSSLAAHAAGGGEQNNTNCNGVGNINSPCQGNNNGGSIIIGSPGAPGAGGQGGIGNGGAGGIGQGGAASSSSSASSSSASTASSVAHSSAAVSSRNTIRNSSRQTTKVVAGGAQVSNTAGGAQVSTNMSVNTVDANSKEVADINAAALIEAAKQSVRNTPNVGAPNLTSGNDTCMGSASGGVSVPGFGISAGSTWTDENCKMLKNSRELWNMGMKAAALALMCNDKANRQALESTGHECPKKDEKSE